MNAGGVVVDTALGAAFPQTAERPRRLRYRGDRAVVTLQSGAGGTYEARLSLKSVDLGASIVPLISANLQVGGLTFTDSLSCGPFGRAAVVSSAAARASGDVRCGPRSRPVKAGPVGDPAVRVRGLRHLALRVRDVQAAARFYRETFGMRVVWEPDPQNVYLSSGSDNLALHEDAGARSGGALDHLGFLVGTPEEVDAAAAAHRARGVPIAREPARHRDGSVSCYCRVPDGNLVQILYLPGTTE